MGGLDKKNFTFIGHLQKRFYYVTCLKSASAVIGRSGEAVEV